MDFSMLPPEINSARMYAGPGTGPILAAATAWRQLAAELQSAATSHRSVLSALGTSWHGPSAATMATAAAPYVNWLEVTAGQAEHTAGQAETAAAAYETAFTATVPPPAVAANRSRLMSLLATNFFGQNLPAIMVTEAQYAEMWAQDAAAMSGYAQSSASASRLRPFGPPPRTANPAQSPAGPGSPAQAADPSGLLGVLTNVTIGSLSPLNLLSTPAGSYLVGIQFYALAQGGFNLAQISEKVAGASSAATTPAIPPIPAVPGTTFVHALRVGTAASIGRAHMVGNLSVPPSWASSAPAIRPAPMALPMASAGILSGTSSASGATAATGEHGALFGGIALSGLAARALAGPGRPVASASSSDPGSPTVPAAEAATATIFVIADDE